MIHSRVINWIRKQYLRKFFVISAVILLVASILAFGMALQISDSVERTQLNQVESNAASQSQYITQWADGKEVYLSTYADHIESVFHSSPTNKVHIHGANDSSSVNNHSFVSNSFQNTSKVTMADTASRNVSHVLQEEVSNKSGSLEAFYLIRSSNDSSRSGVVTHSSDTDRINKSVSDLRINLGETSSDELRTFGDVRQSNGFVTWVYSRSGNKYMSFISPVFEDGYLAAEYNLSRQDNGIQQNVIQQQKDTDTYILGGVSAYVMFGNSSTSSFYPYSGKQNATIIGQKILNREDTTTPISGSYIGEKSVIGYQSVSYDEIDWVIVREVPQKQALAITQRVQTDIIYLISIMFLGFIATAISARRSLVLPIRELLEALRKVGKGETDIETVSSNRIDEVGELYTIAEQITEQHVTVSKQLRAISQQEFEHEVFEKSVPGQLGRAISNMQRELQRYIDQLRSEQKRYSRLVEQNVHSIAVIQDERFVFTNEQFLEMTGYDSNELLTTDPQDIIYPHTDSFVERTLVKLTEDDFEDTNEISRETVQLRQATGERRTVELSASPIEHSNAPAVIISIRDITERDRDQKRLQVFNRVLRHNIRSNVQVITAGLDSIPEEQRTEKVELARKHTEKTLKTTNKARMIGNSLDNYEIRATSVCNPISVVVERVNEQHPDVDVSVNCSEEPVVTIPTNFTEALWELVENAAIHSGTDAEIEITVTKSEPFVVVSISDNGPGMPRREWQPLVEGNQTQLKHGSGLGLWFVKWTLDIVGGSMDVTIDNGTTVLAYIPLADSSQVDDSDSKNDDRGAMSGESVDVNFDVGLEEESVTTSESDDTDFEWVDID